MSLLLTRDEFRNAVFERDSNKCVSCGGKGQDAHHIMERRLFPDGGYYLDNGATLCAHCHLKAEQTVLSPAYIRACAHIGKIILPPHLYPDYEYDKWGNITNPNGTRLKGELFHDESVQKALEAGGVLSQFMPYVKYPRTFHLPFSMGRTDDDKVLDDCSNFEGKNVIVTLKMDGENTTAYQDGYIHARSLDGRSNQTRDWIKKLLTSVIYELPKDWRISGENLYAKHSIHYKNLDTYFYLFSIWDERNNCLSWNVTEEWAAMLELQTVPVLYRGKWDEGIIKNLFKQQYADNEMEGFVVRLADGFSYGDFKKSMAKFVRPNHVQTNQHWLKTKIIPNKLFKKGA